VILCVCPSPALDVTYHVERLVTGATNRARGVTHRPGGKAVNVVRVLHQLGVDTQLLAPVGGADGDRFAADLAALGVPTTAVETSTPTRRTLTVVDESCGAATLISEPAVIDCWDEVVRVAEQLIAPADAVVVSGTLPSGAPVDGVGALVRLCHSHETPVLVDTSGSALRHALDARPTMIKPNLDELADCSSETDPRRAAPELAATYGTTVVVSRGADGVIAATPDRAWDVRPQFVTGNPTGAGDALVAGLARGLVAGLDLAELVRDAVALSAAAVLCPHAGEVDLAGYDEQRRGVTVQELTP
jgi:tagatose 6-phosphate kinase